MLLALLFLAQVVIPATFPATSDLLVQLIPIHRPDSDWGLKGGMGSCILVSWFV